VNCWLCRRRRKKSGLATGPHFSHRGGERGNAGLSSSEAEKGTSLIILFLVGKEGRRPTAVSGRGVLSGGVEEGMSRSCRWESRGPWAKVTQVALGEGGGDQRLRCTDSGMGLGCWKSSGITLQSLMQSGRGGLLAALMIKRNVNRMRVSTSCCGTS